VVGHHWRGKSAPEPPFQDCVSLVKVRRPREVPSARKRPARTQNRDDPNAFDERMPVPPKSTSVSLGVLPGQSYGWFLELWEQSFPSEIGQDPITAKSWLEPYTKNCARKATRKNFQLENTFRRR